MRGEGYLSRHAESYNKNRLSEYRQTEQEREQKNISGHQEFLFGEVKVSIVSHESALPEQLSRAFGTSESLELEDVKIHLGLKSLRLSEIMDEPPVVFLVLGSKRISGSHLGQIASEEYPNGCIAINHLSSPRDVLALFHELGHNSIWQASEREKKYQIQSQRSSLKNGEFDPITAESILKAERDAWAFALKQLRPFLDKGSGVDGMMSVAEARYFIHDIALSSYARKLKRKLDESEEKEVETAISEALEDAQITEV